MGQICKGLGRDAYILPLQFTGLPLTSDMIF
jgi:hypothetical protein